jgi:hypothetical protein
MPDRSPGPPRTPDSGRTPRIGPTREKGIHARRRVKLLRAAARRRAIIAFPRAAIWDYSEDGSCYVMKSYFRAH